MDREELFVDMNERGITHYYVCAEILKFMKESFNEDIDLNNQMLGMIFATSYMALAMNGAHEQELEAYIKESCGALERTMRQMWEKHPFVKQAYERVKEIAAMEQGEKETKQ